MGVGENGEGGRGAAGVFPCTCKTATWKTAIMITTKDKKTNRTKRMSFLEMP